MSTPRVEPGSGTVEGASFPWMVKALATLLVAALVALAWRLADEAPLAQIDRSGRIFLLAVAIVILSGYWTILRSRTSVGDGVIRQRGFGTREVRFEDITQLRLLQAPRLSWIVVPRLVVRSRGWGLSTFQAGDPCVLAAFQRLASGRE